MTTLRCAGALALTLCSNACAARGAPEGARPVVVAPAASSVPDVVEVADVVATAEPVPETLVDRANARLGRRGTATLAVEWPGAGGFDDVLALDAMVLSTPNDARRMHGLAWLRLGGEVTGDGAPMAFPIENNEVDSLATLDLNGDGRHELLVFLRRGDLAPAGSVAAFDLPAGRGQPLLMGRESAVLDGAHSLDDVRARMPVTRGVTPADITEQATLTSVLGRMAFATQAQLAAVSSARFEVCRVEYDHHRSRAMPPRCRRVPLATLPAVRFTHDVARLLEGALDPMTVMGWECPSRPSGDCRSVRSGGYITDFTFEGTGAQRRLRRITETDQGLGE